jgi:hypothetical protein
MGGEAIARRNGLVADISGKWLEEGQIRAEVIHRDCRFTTHPHSNAVRLVLQGGLPRDELEGELDRPPNGRVGGFLVSLRLLR